MRAISLVLVMACGAEAETFVNREAGYQLRPVPGWQIRTESRPEETYFDHGDGSCLAILQLPVQVSPDRKKLEQTALGISREIQRKAGDVMVRAEDRTFDIAGCEAASWAHDLPVEGRPTRMIGAVFYRKDDPSPKLFQAIGTIAHTSVASRRPEIDRMLGSWTWLDAPDPAVAPGVPVGRTFRPWVMEGFSDPEDFPEAEVYVGPVSSLARRLLEAFLLPLATLLALGFLLRPERDRVRQAAHLALIGTILGFLFAVLFWKSSTWPLGDSPWTSLGFFSRIWIFLKSSVTCLLFAVGGVLFRMLILYSTLRGSLDVRAARDMCLLAVASAAGLAAGDLYRSITGEDSLVVFLQGCLMVSGELLSAVIWGYYVGLWRARSLPGVKTVAEGVVLASGVRFLWLGSAAAVPAWLSIPLQAAGVAALARFLLPGMLQNTHMPWSAPGVPPGPAGAPPVENGSGSADGVPVRPPGAHSGPV